MTIGGEELLKEYGSPLAVAEALLLGKIGSYRQQYVCDVVGKTVMEAAKFRVEMYLASGAVKLIDDKVLKS